VRNPGPWYLYVALIAFVIGMLVIDLRFFHAEKHDPRGGMGDDEATEAEACISS
jgi:hypothetical protein